MLVRPAPEDLRIISFYLGRIFNVVAVASVIPLVWAAGVGAWLPVVVGRANLPYTALTVVSAIVFGVACARERLAAVRVARPEISRRLVAATRLVTVLMALAFGIGVAAH